MQKGVVAARIYYSHNFTPMADLRFNDGVVETIRWTDVEQRKAFESYLNGYTLIYDEREKKPWNEWL